MAKGNGTAKTDGLLEKILEEMKRGNRQHRGTRRELRRINDQLETIDSRLQTLDAHVELMRLGYHDVRDRVTALEQRSSPEK